MDNDVLAQRVSRFMRHKGAHDVDPNPLVQWAQAAISAGDEGVGCIVDDAGVIHATTRTEDGDYVVSPADCVRLGLAGAELMWGIAAAMTRSGRPVIHVRWRHLCAGD